MVQVVLNQPMDHVSLSFGSARNILVSSWIMTVFFRFLLMASSMVVYFGPPYITGYSIELSRRLVMECRTLIANIGNLDNLPVGSKYLIMRADNRSPSAEAIHIRDSRVLSCMDSTLPAREFP